MSNTNLAKRHNFIAETTFAAKVWGLRFKRLITNYIKPTKKHKLSNKLSNMPVVAFSESELWNTDDNAENWILTAGKIENLRIATRKIDGLEIEANQVFSFWKQIGNPILGKGYVIGREIREGCILPVKAGGLCQLSNALYDAAVKANFTILERHKHTKVIKGSLAEKDRDATVKWNYIDLRFKADTSFRIEATLDSQKLRVEFKCAASKGMHNNSYTTIASAKINDCLSCGNLSCYKNENNNSIKKLKSNTAYVLDEYWYEYNEYINTIIKPVDEIIIPLKNNYIYNPARYRWNIKTDVRTKDVKINTIKRALNLRLNTSKNIFKQTSIADELIANSMAKLISLETTHLVISQNLLPFLYKSGILGGRTYDVLMTRLPIDKLQNKLDRAYETHNASKILNDFRADKNLIEIENKALNQARYVISPHQEIIQLYNNKAISLKWHFNVKNKYNPKGKKILYPSSALGRKGAYEVKRLAKEMNLSLIVLDGPEEFNNFWEGINIELFKNNYEDVGLVIYPPYVENQPRKLLKAIEKNIPVVTTNACGLKPDKNIFVIPTGNYEALKLEVSNYINTL